LLLPRVDRHGAAPGGGGGGAHARGARGDLRGGEPHHRGTLARRLAQRARGLMRDEVNAALGQADILVCATTPIVATSVGQTEVTVEHAKVPVRTSLIRYTRPFNLTGHPVASVPCGFTAAGLPVGLQIVGRAFDEATVLRVADAYQRATDWHKRRPPVDPPAPPARPRTDAPGAG